jgi:hypothetical protein
MKTIDIVFDGPPSHESDPEHLNAELQEIRLLAAACFIPSWRELIPARLDALLFPVPTTETKEG